MKKVEIKKITVESAFKVTLYLMIVPAIILLLISIGMLVAGIFMQASQLIFLGVVYAISSIFIIGLYGVFSMLIALIYNALAKKFGGLELTVTDKQEQIEITD